MFFSKYNIKELSTNWTVICSSTNIFLLVLQGEPGTTGAKGDAGAKGESVSASSKLPYFTILNKNEFKSVLQSQISISI